MLQRTALGTAVLNDIVPLVCRPRGVGLTTRQGVRWARPLRRTQCHQANWRTRPPPKALTARAGLQLTPASLEQDAHSTRKEHTHVRPWCRPPRRARQPAPLRWATRSISACRRGPCSSTSLPQARALRMQPRRAWPWHLAPPRAAPALGRGLCGGRCGVPLRDLSVGRCCASLYRSPTVPGRYSHARYHSADRNALAPRSPACG